MDDCKSEQTEAKLKGRSVRLPPTGAINVLGFVAERALLLDESERLIVPRADWLKLPLSPSISWLLGGVSVRADVRRVALRGKWQKTQREKRARVGPEPPKPAASSRFLSDRGGFRGFLAPKAPDERHKVWPDSRLPAFVLSVLPAPSPGGVPVIAPVDMAVRICLAGSPPLRSYFSNHDNQLLLP
ncbi:hypothetical protein FQA47_020092 [Oryzias melastigma]|uniref:Uncharacterized protein n=1 Tax=Oryzias melastigma TaxID=30732 RepID=A0A834FI82_ORYME|nr:hypothetical protein FQA47_020092 [Oryzias melastigma]